MLYKYRPQQVAIKLSRLGVSNFLFFDGEDSQLYITMEVKSKKYQMWYTYFIDYEYGQFRLRK